MAEAEKAPEDELEVADDEEIDGDDLEDDDDGSAAATYLGGDDDEDADETSLEELLAQRAAARRPAEEEEDDIMSLSSEKEPTGAEVINPKVIPLKEQQEFVCQRCRLVKKKSQLADAERMLCRDCV